MADAFLASVVGIVGALAGIVIGQFMATRTATLQADRSERREALQWDRLQAEKRTQALAAKREEFLGLVLISQEKLADQLASVNRRESCQLSASDSASGAARKAYAVALLYLPALQPLAKAFYQSTLNLEFALENSDDDQGEDASSRWRETFDELEKVLQLDSSFPSRSQHQI